MNVVAYPPWPPDAFPYMSWFSTTDHNSSREHLALEKLGLDGTNIFHWDDPCFEGYWLDRLNDVWPCRCDVCPATIEQAAKAGAKEAILWQRTGRPPQQPQFVSLPFDPWVPGPCMLLGWGTRQRWKKKDYKDHPGNPDNWKESWE